MKRAAFFPVFVVAALALAGCGSTSITLNPNPVSVMISPTSATVPLGQTAQFAATVSNAANTAVAWEVNNTPGGNSTVGTISATGLYVAPTTLPTPSQVSVNAVSLASPSASASAQVTIVAATGVTVSPAATSVPAGSSQQFSAFVNGTPTTQVTWEVDNVAGGDSVHGTISTLGLYVAPLAPPPGGVVTITAVTSSSGSGTAAATITFSNASLQGSYAFAFTGNDLNGFFSLAGSFQADGNGNIPAGVEDLNDVSGVFTNVALSGNYSVGPDGRGSATLKSSLGTQTLRFSLLSNQHALVIEFDSFATASGAVDIQDPSAFSNTALAGSYVFNLSGVNGAGGPIGMAGVFTTDGNSGITGGVEDVNDAGGIGSDLPLSGNYSVASDGRGTATIASALGTFNFTFYVVNGGDLKFLEVDTAPVLSGEILGQQGAPYSNASVQGGYAFILGGSSTAGAFAAGGLFTADGNGNLTGGVEDINNNGAVSQNLGISGNYSVASNGRGTATFVSSVGTFQFIFYLSSGSLLEMLETDTNIVSSGSADQQQGASFSNGSLQGSFALNFTGVTNTGEEDGVGHSSADGAGHLTGTLDVNNSGSLFSAIPLSNSTYSLSANGRGTAAFQTAPGTFNMALYSINSSSAFFLDVDSSRVLVGSIGEQF